MTHAELLDVYDRDVRGSFRTRLPQGWVGEQDGPLTRCLTPHGGFAMLTDDSSHLTKAELQALVARTFNFYDNHNRGFEWKTFDHDRGDLRPLLARHGAHPSPTPPATSHRCWRGPVPSLSPRRHSSVPTRPPWPMMWTPARASRLEPSH